MRDPLLKFNHTIDAYTNKVKNVGVGTILFLLLPKMASLSLKSASFNPYVKFVHSPYSILFSPPIFSNSSISSANTRFRVAETIFIKSSF